MIINAVRQQTTSDLSAVVASHHHGSELYVGQVWRSVGTQNCHTSFNVDESSIPRFNQGQRIYKSGIPNRKLWCPTLQFSGGRWGVVAWLSLKSRHLLMLRSAFTTSARSARLAASTLLFRPANICLTGSFASVNCFNKFGFRTGEAPRTVLPTVWHDWRDLWSGYSGFQKMLSSHMTRGVPQKRFAPS